MESKEFVRWQDQEALRRFQLISPLITADADPAKRIAERKRLSETHDISERTLRRYEDAFRKSGFAGLKPAGRAEAEVKGPFPGFKKALDEAILLKREVPSRSVNQIIFILEAEHVVNPGQLTRPTLQRYLYKAGFGKRQMKKVTEGEKSSSRRFCKPHRMMLVQGDYPEFLLIPSFINGCLKQCA